MSSNCPPQLQLSLQSNTTSFKRSFEQFGFDLESPVDGTGGGSGANNGNDRNKRARSASSFSDSSESMDSSQSSSTLASGSSPPGGGSILGPSSSITITSSSSIVPPRLPTPDIQDVEMSDYPGDEQSVVDSFSPVSLAPSSSQAATAAPQNDNRYRLSLERFNAFDTQISVLRQSPALVARALARSPTPPPTLPPLGISDDRPRLSLSTHPIPFLHPRPQLTTPLTESVFGVESPSSTRVQSPTTVRDNSVYDEPVQSRTAEASNAPSVPFRFRQALGLPSTSTSHSHRRSDSSSSRTTLSSFDQDNDRVHEDELEMMTGFRARLSGALERLRPQSPLVPGLELDEVDEDDDEDDEDRDEEEGEEESSTNNLPPHPPTLPPIPSVVEDADIDELLVAQSPLSTNRTSPTAAMTGSSQNLTLGDHQLPSPILRDLHNWMAERTRPGHAENSDHDGGGTTEAANTSSGTSSVDDNTFSTEDFDYLIPGGYNGSASSTTMGIAGSIGGGGGSSSTGTSSSNRLRADEDAVRALDAGVFGARPAASTARRPTDRLSSQAWESASTTRIMEDMGSWERRSFELWNTPTEDSTDNNTSLDPYNLFPAASLSTRHHYRPPTPPRPSSTTSYDASRHIYPSLGARIRHAPATTLFGSSNSLVTENAQESRRRVDHDLMRSAYPSSFGGAPLPPLPTPPLMRRSLNNNWVTDEPPLDDELGRSRQQMITERVEQRLWEIEAAVNDGIDYESEDDERWQRRYAANMRPMRPFHSSTSISTAERSNVPFILPLPLPTPSLDVGSSSSNASTPDERPEGENGNRFGSGYGLGYSLGHDLGMTRRTTTTHLTAGQQEDPRPRHETLRSAELLRQRTQQVVEMARAGSANLDGFENLPHGATSTTTGLQQPSRTRARAHMQSVQQQQRSHSPLQSLPALNFDGFSSEANSDASRAHGRPYPFGPAEYNDIDIEADRNRFRAAVLGRQPFNQSFYGPPPSLPPPDLGNTFVADGHDTSSLVSSSSPSLFSRVQMQEQEQERETREFATSQRRVSSFRGNPFHVPSPPTQHREANDIQAISSQSGVGSYHNSWQVPHESPRRNSFQQMHPDGLDTQPQHQRPTPFTDAQQWTRIQEVQRSMMEASARQAAPLPEAEQREAAAASGASTTRMFDPPSANLRRLSRGLYDDPMPPIRPERAGNPSSPLRRTYVPGDRDRERLASLASSMHAAAAENPYLIDPSMFTPGPFRNTILHGSTNRPSPSQPSAAPSIPPLSFEDTSSAYRTSTRRTSSGATAAGGVDAGPRGSGPAAAAATAGDHPAFDSRRIRLLNSRNPSQAAAAAALMESNRNAIAEQRGRGQTELHRYLSQQVRMEPSRLDNPENPWSSNSANAGAATPAGDTTRPRAFNSSTTTPMEPLRPDGTNHTTRHRQLIQHYHQTEQERRRRSVFRNDATASSSDAGGNTASNPGGGLAAAIAARRLGGLDSDNMQHLLTNRRRRMTRLPPELLALHRMRSGALGDFVLDDEFDDSYEGLLSLAATLGDAKPKATPSDILEKLEKGTYANWKTDDGDTRCPICLDDYAPDDQLLKLNNCSHWLHQECLQQWLQSANTCPVCRKSVHEGPGASSSSSAPRRHFHYHFHRNLPAMSWRGGPPPPPGAGGSSPGMASGTGPHHRSAFG